MIQYKRTGCAIAQCRSPVGPKPGGASILAGVTENKQDSGGETPTSPIDHAQGRSDVKLWYTLDCTGCSATWYLQPRKYRYGPLLTGSKPLPLVLYRDSGVSFPSRPSFAIT